jgi:thiol:disulfide interchange protein DsbA
MRVIRQIKQMMLVLSFGLLAGGAIAAVGNPELGKEYTMLDNPQAVEAGKKIEVIEFFAYYCPHCYALEPLMEEWVKKQGNNIVFKRVHVSDSRAIPQQKLFFALDALNKVEEFQFKAFQAIHVERNRLQTDAEVLAFAVKAGIDKQKFLDAYNSFSAQSKMNRASQLMNAYGVNSWPMIAIDGRFITSPSMVGKATKQQTEEGQNRALLPVMDWIIAKIQKEKGITTTEAAPSAPKKK